MPSNYYCKLCNYNTRVYNSYKIHLDSKTHSNNLVTSIIENKVSTTRPTSNLVTIDNENNSKSDIENIYIKYKQCRLFKQKVEKISKYISMVILTQFILIVLH